MSRYERFGTRSLVYSKWHRFYMNNAEPMIDLDAIEYCGMSRCSKPLVLIETAVDIGQANKPTTVLQSLSQESGILALCVLYRIADGTDRLTGCACERGSVVPGCQHGIDRFRVRKVGPGRPINGWKLLTPEDYRNRLTDVRMAHVAAEHTAWEDAA